MITEFKFIFPVRYFIREIVDLLGRMDQIGNYLVSARQTETIDDTYFDVHVAELNSFFLAAEGLCCRQRTRTDRSVFEIKHTIREANNYLRYETESFQVEASESGILPRNVLEHIRKVTDSSRLPDLVPIGRVLNNRKILVLQNIRCDGLRANLHLDAFRVKDAREKIVGDSEEVEIVSESAQAVLDLTEVLLSSFKVFKVQQSKIQRFADLLAGGSEIVNLWLDADTGVDDAMALLLALRSPERCKVVGVSAVGGNVDVGKVAVNSAKILHYAGGSQPPLFVGYSPRHSSGDASDVHGPEGIGDINEFLESFRPSKPGQIEQGFKEVLNRLGSRKVTFVATGPLTNFAHLIKECPGAVRKLKEVVIMGGAFDEPGNREAVPEFNIFADPESARTVLDFCRQNTLKHTFVSLDVTHRVILKSEHVQQFKREGFRSAAFIASLTEHYMRFYDRNQAMAGCPLHDPMAVGFALWPELFIADDFHVEIAPSNCGPFSGATSADLRPTRLFRDRSKEVTGIVLRVDRERFLQKIEEKLLRR
jgi:purine nucleosidase